MKLKKIIIVNSIIILLFILIDSLLLFNNKKEIDVWNLAVKESSDSSFNSYISKYPNGLFLKSANFNLNKFKLINTNALEPNKKIIVKQNLKEDKSNNLTQIIESSEVDCEIKEENESNKSKQVTNNVKLVHDSNINEARVYSNIEEMPSFPGGDLELLSFIDKNLKYPIAEQQNGIHGRVILRFIVSKTGKVNNVEVIRSLDRDCDKEAVRVVESLPNFIPGKHNGENVSVFYTLPITYKLE